MTSDHKKVTATNKAQLNQAPSEQTSGGQINDKQSSTEVTYSGSDKEYDQKLAFDVGNNHGYFVGLKGAKGAPFKLTENKADTAVRFMLYWNYFPTAFFSFIREMIRLGHRTSKAH